MYCTDENCIFMRSRVPSMCGCVRLLREGLRVCMQPPTHQPRTPLPTSKPPTERPTQFLQVFMFTLRKARLVSLQSQLMARQTRNVKNLFIRKRSIKTSATGSSSTVRLKMATLAVLDVASSNKQFLPPVTIRVTGSRRGEKSDLGNL